MAKAVCEVGDWLDAAGVGGADEGHHAVADLSARLRLVVEGGREVADWDDELLLDEVGVEGNAGGFVEAGEAGPLVDDEAQWLPEGGVRLDEFAAEFFGSSAESVGKPDLKSSCPLFRGLEPCPTLREMLLGK
jgi:hypothetical protein